MLLIWRRNWRTQKRIFGSFRAYVTAGIGVKHRIVLTVRIQIQPIAAVSVLLSEPGDDRIVEPCAQAILLGDQVKLLAGEFEAVGDGFLLSRKVAPSVIGIVVKDNAISINNMGN